MPQWLTREQVKHLGEPEKNHLRAEAFALVAKGQAATGTAALALSEADAACLCDLMRCGMLPSDPPPPQPITPERNAELPDMARQRNEADQPNPEARKLAVKIAAAGGRDKARKRDVERFDYLMDNGGGGGFYPLILNDATEAERVRTLQAELTTAAIAGNVQAERAKEIGGGRNGGIKSGAKRIANRGDCIENHRAEFDRLCKTMTPRSAAMIIAKKTGFNFDAIARHFKNHPTE